MALLRSLPSALTMLVVFTGLSQASTLLSENFDELTAALAVTSVGSFSAIGGTNVDIVGPGDGFGGLCATPESGNCVDLDGSGGLSQGILRSNSSFSLTPGANYYLSFDLIGSGRGVATSTTVNFGPYTQTFSLASGDVTSGVVANELISVPTAASYYLTFTSNTPGDVGSVLDNVSITTSTVTTSPEPATLLLTIPILLVGFAFWRRAHRVPIS